MEELLWTKPVHVARGSDCGFLGGAKSSVRSRNLEVDCPARLMGLTKRSQEGRRALAGR